MILGSAASSYPVSQKANVISEERILRFLHSSIPFQRMESPPFLSYQLQCRTLTFEWKLLSITREGEIKRDPFENRRRKEKETQGRPALNYFIDFIHIKAVINGTLEYVLLHLILIHTLKKTLNFWVFLQFLCAGEFSDRMLGDLLSV